MSEVLTREIDELRLLMGSPRDPHGRVFAQLGDALRRAGFHREALDVLRDGVSEHPNFTPGHLVLGWTAQEMGDLQAARTAYERTVELDPENPNGLFGLGMLLDRDGNPDGASLIEEAESLDGRVREVAPGFPGPRMVEDPTPPGTEGGFGIDVPEAESDGEDSLADLPFLPLAELAPGGPEDASLDSLPFVPLSELAPDRPAEVEPDPEGEFAEPPFVALEDLAPDPAAEDRERDGADGTDDLEALPFVPLDDLRPDAVEADGDETPDVLVGPLATRTMGELLMRQGLTAEAVEVFETLVARSPDDDELRERLDELRALLSPDPPAPAVDAPGESPTPGAVDGRHEAEVVEEEADEEQADEVEADEAAAHPSMDPPVPDPEFLSPFHLGAGEGDDEADEEEAEESVGNYFARLLAWSPNRGPSGVDSAAESTEGEEPTPS